MKQITIDAPCKINLSLDIVRRLENGYHEMDMVMQSVSLYDTLTLSLQEGSDNSSDQANPYDGRTWRRKC